MQPLRSGSRVARQEIELSALRLSWNPSTFGKLLTSTPEWSLTIHDRAFDLVVGARKITQPLTSLGGLKVKPGLLWSGIRFADTDGHEVLLDGLPNADAERLQKAVADALERVRVGQLIAAFDRVAPKLVSRHEAIARASNAQLARRGWLGREFAAKLEDFKPAEAVGLLGQPEVQNYVTSQSEALQRAVRFWQVPMADFVRRSNKLHAEKAFVDDKVFFDTVEKSPLTAEQRQAVVCFDDRVLLVASAGSGKTSVMVAKAGYALRRGYFAADKILLLAFNSDAAAELRERIKDRLAPLGLPADAVAARTFHAFGLDVIGKATGRRPSLAPWLDRGQDICTLVELVDRLKANDEDFRTGWDLLRMVFGQDMPKFGKDSDAAESWDRDKKRPGFWTLHNEVVKSRGEQILANWLFYNGVRYVYEAPYRHDTADANHRQYCPDFYFPDADAYLEHWALDERGEPPPEFMNYKEGMAWKRKVHADRGTRLLETTMADLWSGKAFKYLRQELTHLGIVLDPNPDRQVPGRQPIENERLARTFRSFLTHAKSNRLVVRDLRERLVSGVAGQFRFRHELFLRLFEVLWQAWEAKLRAAQCIDFEDMLNLATDCIEVCQWVSPYELVMVDEFQDASQARARMLASLLRGPDKYLFAVGDDWQSINRFTGADLSVMTSFEQRFGAGTTLKLETTFRCPPSLCAISSTFVRKNPRQIDKSVRSPKPDIAEPVGIVRVPEATAMRVGVEARVAEIAAEASTASKKVSVFVLGRYNKDSAAMPTSYDRHWVDLKFITVHASKGLEADHVIVPGLSTDGLGFPSRIIDDPVLLLAMPGGDDYPHAKERRLFYVALTRARATVTLITVARKESAFIIELVREQKIKLRNIDGSSATTTLCPDCGSGFLIQRSGRFGPFLGCTGYPRCEHTRKMEQARSSGRGPRQRGRSH